MKELRWGVNVWREWKLGSGEGIGGDVMGLLWVVEKGRVVIFNNLFIHFLIYYFISIYIYYIIHLILN